MKTKTSPSHIPRQRDMCKYLSCNYLSFLGCSGVMFIYEGAEIETDKNVSAEDIPVKDVTAEDVPVYVYTGVS